MGIPRAMLPRDPLLQRGLRRGVAATAARRPPVAGILGDQQAALFGQTCFARGEAKNTYGTGSFLLVNTGAEIVRSRAAADERRLPARRRRADATCWRARSPSPARLVQWLRDQLGLIASAAEVEALARTRARQRRRLLRAGVLGPVRAVLARRRARRDRRPDRATPRGHIARAALEATAWQTREVRRRRPTPSPACRCSELRVDGGMTANELLMQFQADVLACPVVRPAVDRDDGARRRVRRRAGGRLLVGLRRSCASAGARTAAGSREWSRSAASASTRGGSGPSRARSTGPAERSGSTNAPAAVPDLRFDVPGAVLLRGALAAAAAAQARTGPVDVADRRAGGDVRVRRARRRDLSVVVAVRVGVRSTRSPAWRRSRP